MTETTASALSKATLATDPFDDDHFHEECGVFGVFGHPEAGALTALGLHALQHRGQEAAGIVSYDGRQFHSHRGLGQVGDNFSSKDVIERLKGMAAIGHNRYATTGEVVLRNVQPLFGDFEFGGLAICHNGNLTNSYQLRSQLVRRGSLFQSTSDTEVIIHLIATSLRRSVVERVVDALRQVEGAYSLVAMSKDGIIGVRDPLGVRPAGARQARHRLGAGVRDRGARHHQCRVRARRRAGARSSSSTRRASRASGPSAPRHRASASSNIFTSPGRTAWSRARTSMMCASASAANWRERAWSMPTRSSPFPIPACRRRWGYALESGLPFEHGIVRNHYVGRTFIEPTDQIRHLGVKLKHNPNRRFIEGKRVILVDDSIVRGTTSLKIVEMVRQAGAKEVHMRISSPPTSHSCFYGIATPEREKLLASRMDVAEMAKFIGADSLAFISIEGLYRALGEARRDSGAPKYCDACFSGDYPIPISDFSQGNLATSLSQMAEFG